MVYISRGTMIETCNDLKNLYKFFHDAVFRARPPPSVKRRFENFMVSGYPTPFARTRAGAAAERTYGFRMLRVRVIMLHDALFDRALSTRPKAQQTSSRVSP